MTDKRITGKKVATGKNVVTTGKTPPSKIIPAKPKRR